MNKHFLFIVNFLIFIVGTGYVYADNSTSVTVTTTVSQGCSVSTDKPSVELESGELGELQQLPNGTHSNIKVSFNVIPDCGENYHYKISTTAGQAQTDPSCAVPSQGGLGFCLEHDDSIVSLFSGDDFIPVENGSGPDTFTVHRLIDDASGITVGDYTITISFMIEPD